MSTTLSSASLKPKKASKNIIVEFFMTVFSVIFVLSPIAIMVVWVTESIDFNGAGNLLNEMSSALFDAKED